MKKRPAWSSRLLVLTLAGAIGACGSSKANEDDESPSTDTDNENSSDDTGAEDTDDEPSGPGKKDAGQGVDAGKQPGSGGSIDAGKPSSGTQNDAGAAAPSGDGGSVSAPSGPSVACNPADKKPDPTPASFTQIQGYGSLTKEPVTGPLKPVLEEDPGLPKWTIYRPEVLGGETKHAILIWAEGGCLQNGTLYGQWLLELASHGFIALGDGSPLPAGASPGSGGQRTDQSGKPMMAALDWLTAENERPCSQYYHKLDITKVAVAGQSCGGLMAMSAAGDKRITTSIIANSGLFASNQKIYSALHSPMAFLIGGESDMAYPNAERDVAAINTVPIFYANLAVGHGGTWSQKNAGEFGRVGLGWLKWQLLGDTTAEKMFVGADCELCKPPSMWVVEKKMLQ